jgi:phosphotransferase system HPr-like phosphotransfer protein
MIKTEITLPEERDTGFLLELMEKLQNNKCNIELINNNQEVNYKSYMDFLLFFYIENKYTLIISGEDESIVLSGIQSLIDSYNNEIEIKNKLFENKYNNCIDNKHILMLDSCSKVQEIYNSKLGVSSECRQEILTNLKVLGYTVSFLGMEQFPISNILTSRMIESHPLNEYELEDKIKSDCPKCIIIHQGEAFSTFKDELLITLKYNQEKYPFIPFIFEFDRNKNKCGNKCGDNICYKIADTVFSYKTSGNY